MVKVKRKRIQSGLVRHRKSSSSVYTKCVLFVLASVLIGNAIYVFTAYDGNGNTDKLVSRSSTKADSKTINDNSFKNYHSIKSGASTTTSTSTTSGHLWNDKVTTTASHVDNGYQSVGQGLRGENEVKQVSSDQSRDYEHVSVENHVEDASSDKDESEEKEKEEEMNQEEEEDKNEEEREEEEDKNQEEEDKNEEEGGEEEKNEEQEEEKNKEQEEEMNQDEIEQPGESSKDEDQEHQDNEQGEEREENRSKEENKEPDGENETAEEQNEEKETQEDYGNKDETDEKEGSENDNQNDEKNQDEVKTSDKNKEEANKTDAKEEETKKTEEQDEEQKPQEESQEKPSEEVQAPSDVDQNSTASEEKSENTTSTALPKFNREHYDVCIIGAGLSGAVIAERYASQLGKTSLVLEKRDHIGGNCYDFVDEETGILMNKYGAHLFHTNYERVWEYIQQFSDWTPYEHRVLGKIGDKHVPIPVNIDTVNALYDLQIDSTEEMDKWLNNEQTKYDHDPVNSEEMALSRVGPRLYKEIFEPYTVKQWAKHPKELGPEVTARIPVRNNHDDRYFGDKYQVLPTKGYTAFFEKVLAHELIETHLNVDYFEVRDQLNCGHTYFTGPIDAYFAHLGYEKLEYRSLDFEKQVIRDIGDDKYHLPASVVNYPSAEYNFTRIVEYKHFLNQTSPHTVLFLERSKDGGEPYYPVPNERNKDLYEKYREMALKEANVTFVGRLANYKYFNMDQSIMNALELFDLDTNSTKETVTNETKDAPEADKESQANETKETKDSPQADQKSQADETNETKDASQADQKSQGDETTETKDAPQAEQESKTDETSENKDAPQADKESKTDETSETKDAPQAEQESKTDETSEAKNAPQAEQESKTDETKETKDSPEAEQESKTDETKETKDAPQAEQESQADETSENKNAPQADKESQADETSETKDAPQADKDSQADETSENKDAPQADKESQADETNTDAQSEAKNEQTEKEATEVEETKEESTNEQQEKDGSTKKEEAKKDTPIEAAKEDAATEETVKEEEEKATTA